MKLKKSLAVMLAVASITTASSALAATIYNSQGNAFPTYNAVAAPTVYTTDTSYKVALEVYNSTAGVTTIAGDGTSFGQLNIALTQPLVPLQNLNIRVSNNTADFYTAGPGFNRYGICRLRNPGNTAYLNTTTVTAAEILGAQCLPGDIVAVMPPSGVNAETLGLQVNSSETPLQKGTAYAVFIAAYNNELAFYNVGLNLPAFKTAVDTAADTFIAAAAGTYLPPPDAITARTAAFNALITTLADPVSTPLAIAANITTIKGLVGVTASSNSVVRLVQFDDFSAVAPAVPANAQLDPGETLINGASIWMYDQLSASCDTSPIVQMTFSSSGGESTALPINFAYITPQFTFTAPTAGTLNAELDTDLDFTSFVLGSGDSASILDETTITKDAFYSITNAAPGTGPSLWIGYALISPLGNISYDLTTAAPEPGIATGGVVADHTACTVSGAAPLVYNCDVTAQALEGDHHIGITINGTSENNPTNWTLSNFALSVTTAGVGTICASTPSATVGSWYGGIEAIVPFVKAASGYETYIKLYNRYSKSAKVYVSNMNTISTTIVTSIKQLSGGQNKNSAGLYDNSAIPAGGFVTITATELGSISCPAGVCTPGTIAQGALVDSVTASLAGGTSLTQGVPIKFLIRVPAQMGALTNLAVSTIPITGITGSAAGSAIGVSGVSVVDPYITGFVVSTYTGGQRSVPIMFKSYKQGQYN